MRIISKPIDLPVPEDLLTNMRPLSDFLFLDIETTGLSAEHNAVYLVGCVYREPDGWNLIQWMDTTGNEEKEVLSSFWLFASRYPVLVHYNGDRFDLPFLKKRMEAHALPNSMDEMESLDLYKVILPCRRLLGLSDYKQQTMEALLGSGRTESESGGDLVRVYKKYIVDSDPALLSKLLAHNEADVLGLLSLVPLLIYKDLENASFHVRRAQANYYNDYDGSRKEELFLFFRLSRALPAPVYASADHCYVKIEGDEGILKIPLYTEVMKYFYANYKDYYFLPEEDMAVHKYLASYVEKSHRIQAKPETCYTRKAGSFLPQWDLYRTPFFKRAYADKELFFEFSDECKKDRRFLSDYAFYVFTHIKNSK
jgi:hypothetical protein